MSSTTVCIARRRPPVLRPTLTLATACCLLLQALLPPELRAGETYGTHARTPQSTFGPVPEGGAQRRAVFLLDRTSSMGAIRPGSGRSRCSHSRERALTEIGNYFEGNSGGLAAVYVFGGPTELVNLTGGYVNATTARNAIAALPAEGCSYSSTALAQAICSVVNNLAQFPSPTFERKLFVSSDGGENSSTGECAGPPSATLTPPFTSGSWQNLAFLKLTNPAGRPASYNDYWGDNTRAGAPQILEPGAPLVQPDSAADAAFFEATAVATGGAYLQIPDALSTLPPPFVASVPVFRSGLEPLPILRIGEYLEQVTSNSAPAADGSCTLAPVLANLGWFARNNSAPLGTTCIFQGNSTVFAAHGGTAASYAGFNFNSTGNLGTISTWLVTPIVDFGAEATLEFWLRTTDSTTIYPDRLQVRLTTLQTTPPSVGTGPDQVGQFGTLLLDINPQLGSADPLCGVGLTNPPGAVVNGFPRGNWCRIRLTNASGIPQSGRGRFAFRYFVSGGGATGANSDYIGLDSITYSSR